MSVCWLTGGYEDSDQIKDNVHVTDASWVTSSWPAAEVSQTRCDARQWGTASAVDHGTWTKPRTTQTEATIIAQRWSADGLGRPWWINWTALAVSASHAVLPGPLSMLSICSYVVASRSRAKYIPLFANAWQYFECLLTVASICCEYWTGSIGEGGKTAHVCQYSKIVSSPTCSYFVEKLTVSGLKMGLGLANAVTANPISPRRPAATNIGLLQSTGGRLPAASMLGDQTV